MELRREDAKDPCYHDVVQSNTIDRRIGDIGEDMVVEGVATKCDKHEVAPPLVVGQRGFQNDRDHGSCVLEAGSLCMQVRGVGGDIVLGDRDPLGSGELMF
jgi:hypothetical protein